MDIGSSGGNGNPYVATQIYQHRSLTVNDYINITNPSVLDENVLKEIKYECLRDEKENLYSNNKKRKLDASFCADKLHKKAKIEGNNGFEENVFDKNKINDAANFSENACVRDSENAYVYDESGIIIAYTMPSHNYIIDGLNIIKEEESKMRDKVSGNVKKGCGVVSTPVIPSNCWLA